MHGSHSKVTLFHWEFNGHDVQYSPLKNGFLSGQGEHSFVSIWKTCPLGQSLQVNVWKSKYLGWMHSTQVLLFQKYPFEFSH